MGIPRRRGLVDHDQALAAEVIDKPRGRVDRQGSASDDQHLGVRDRLDGLADHLVVESLLVKDDIRLDDPAALAPGYALRALDMGKVIDGIIERDPCATDEEYIKIAKADTIRKLSA